MFIGISVYLSVVAWLIVGISALITLLFGGDPGWTMDANFNEKMPIPFWTVVWVAVFVFGWAENLRDDRR